jgi:signal transduction histidine kinase
MEVMIEKRLIGVEKRPSVLVVEDDVESAKLLQTLFKRKGCKVVGLAVNGKEALEKYKRLRPDIVTMDIMMPSVDGRTCTKNILEFDPKANIVVVSVLGHEELEALKSLGVKAFIKKPIDIEELFDAIINISISILTDDKGKELGAVGMASSVEEEAISSRLFIDILRHDILNPLGLIKNFAELIFDDVPENLRPQLEAIIRNSDRLIEIIEDASKLSKIEKIKGLDLEELELAGLIEGNVRSLTPLIKKKGLKLENRVKGKIFIEASFLLSTVIFNILSNAIKYSPDNGSITIDSTDEGDDITISIEDSGQGVKNEYKDTIFERFNHSTKQGVVGAGIGLATAKKVVDLHRGRIWVEDNPTGGSIFKVRIPKRGVGG